MKRTRVPALAFLAVLTAACAEAPPTAPAVSEEPAYTKPVKDDGSGGGTGLYHLRFIAERLDGNGDLIEGEITSDTFPAGGIKLDTNDPWRNLEVSGAAWALNNFTHGIRTLGTCTVDTDVDVNWDISGTDPVLSFQGNWEGKVSFWRNRGMHFYLEGPRAGGAGGVIQNIASNYNQTKESDGVTDGKRWFKIRFTNARLGFGGASSPDGEITLDQLPGYESACANFTVLATEI